MAWYAHDESHNVVDFGSSGAKASDILTADQGEATLFAMEALNANMLGDNPISTVHPFLCSGSRFGQRRFRSTGRTGFGYYLSEEAPQAEPMKSTQLFGSAKRINWGRSVGPLAPVR